MFNKFVESAEAAVAGIADGAVVMVHGFGPTSCPIELIDALLEHTDARDLTVVSNNSGVGYEGIGKLLASGRVRKIICSYPRMLPWMPNPFEELYKEGRIELEVVPQGTLSERMRAAAAGVAGFYVPTTVGTVLAEGKEVRVFDGREHVLERALPADVALISAECADRWGNLTYRLTSRNFGPTMAMAAKLTLVQARRTTEPDPIDPEAVITPGIFVNRVVHIPQPKLLNWS